MLPNLRYINKQRTITQTPDVSLKRLHTVRSDHTDIHTLKKQVDSLKKQLELTQSVNFGMTITTGSTQYQQCQQCQKYKQQIEVLNMNDKVKKKNYDQKIEELQRLISKGKIQQPQNEEIITQYDQLINQLKSIDNNDLFFLKKCQTTEIQFFKKDYFQQQQQQFEQLQIENEKLQQLIQDLKSQINYNEARIQEQNNQINYQQNQLEQLKKQIKEFNEQRRKSQQIFCQPLQDHQPKLNTEPIDKNFFQQLAIENQSLKDKLIKQNQTIDKKVQQNKISEHFMRIDLLETELKLSLRCCRCQNLLEKPRTYIPCGHSCCEKCYKPQCDKCDTEAVYRNRQFDELIRVYHMIKDTKIFIQETLLVLQQY